MKRSIVMTIAALALVAATTVSARDNSATRPDETTVQKAVDKFYKAINALFEGDVEPLTHVWSHADDITYMGPDGTVNVGWKQTLDNLQNQATMRLGGEIRHEPIMMTISHDLAVVECHEVGQNVISGKQVPVLLRATNVFRKENGEWKLIGHHTDKLPFMQQ